MPEIMGDAHDLEPALRIHLEPRYRIAHAVDENLAAASGHRIETRRAQTGEHHLIRHVLESGDVVNFRRTQGVEMKVRELSLHPGEELLVPFDPEIGVVSPLEQNLLAADGVELIEL